MSNSQFMFSFQKIWYINISELKFSVFYKVDLEITMLLRSPILLITNHCFTLTFCKVSVSVKLEKRSIYATLIINK